MASSSFLIQSTSSIPLELITAASTEVELGAQKSVKSYLELAWSPSCQAILEVYVKEHYNKISADSPEFEILKRPEVKKTGGRVFKLLGGQEYALPGDSWSSEPGPYADFVEPRVAGVSEGHLRAEMLWTWNGGVHNAGDGV